MEPTLHPTAYLAAERQHALRTEAASHRRAPRRTRRSIHLTVREPLRRLFNRTPHLAAPQPGELLSAR